MAIKLKPGVVAKVAPSALQRDPKQPRQTFDEAGLRSLGESMKVKQEDPIKVRQEGKDLIIHDGERRWRAAKLVKLPTVDVLLEERTDAIDIAASQLTTAVQREQLSPLDIAEFLVGLQKRNRSSANELLAALDKRGIKEIGPAKLQAIMRLVELPEWAKELMRDGTFGEGHGQALLVAIKFPGVLKHVQEQTARDIKWKGGVTVKEVTDDVEHGFRIAGTDLNQKHGEPEDIRAFPIEQCRSCEFYKKIGGTEYCMNRKLFDKKQREALLIKSQREAEKAEREKNKAQAAKDAKTTDPTQVEPRKLKRSDDNVVVLKRMSYETHKSLEFAGFDQAQCKTCVHRQLASHDGKKADAEDHCFFPPCFDEKQRLSSRDESRRGKMREYLEAWLRPIVIREAAKRLKANQQYGIVLWLATGAVDRGSSFYAGQMHERAARATQAFLQKHRLKSFPELMQFATTSWGPPHLAQLVADSVQVMTQEQLYWFAHYINIELSDPAFAYRVDEGFLRMKRKGEIQELLRAALEGKAPGTVEALDIGHLSADALRELAISHAENIGVPAELQALYHEPAKQQDDVDELDEDDLELELKSQTVCIGCGCSDMDACEGGCSWIVQEEKRSYMSDGNPLGVCSECPEHMERWRRGDRDLTPEADTRAAMRMEAAKHDELDSAAPAIAAALDEKPARKKRRA